MKKAIILHGTLGSPEGNWFLWLKDELEKNGLEVWLPQLPNAHQPSLRKYLHFIKHQCPFVIDEETLIVGHSSGAIAALVLAANNVKLIGAIVDVSVFYDNSLKWGPNNQLFDIELDWPTIKQGVNKLLFIHSDNDPYVPLEQAQYVASNTGGELIVLKGQGHFNLELSDSYKQFPDLLRIIKDRVLA